MSRQRRHRPAQQAARCEQYLDLDPREWSPLRDAHAQIIARLGSWSLAEIDLNGDLARGRLQAVYRLYFRYVGDPPVYENCGCLLRLFWQHNRVEVSSTGYIRWTGADDWFDHVQLRSLHVFVRRAELDQHYPRSLDEPPVAAAAIEAQPPHRRGRGWTHEWHLIDGQIAALCINPATNRLRVPDKDSAIVADVRKWLLDNNKAVPSDSQLFEAVSQVCAPLRELERKLRERKPRRARR